MNVMDANSKLNMQANATQRGVLKEIFIGAYDDDDEPRKIWNWSHMLTIDQANTMMKEIERALYMSSTITEKS